MARPAAHRQPAALCGALSPLGIYPGVHGPTIPQPARRGKASKRPATFTEVPSWA